MIDEKQIKKVINKGKKILVNKWLSKSEFKDFVDNDKIKECIKLCTSPDTKDIFNAFSLFSIEETRVLILGQDPYPDDDDYRIIHYGKRAHGFAFSFKNPEEPADDSLLNIFKALDKYINKPSKSDIYTWNTNLEKWAEENKVLLLNTALTYEKLENASKKEQDKCQNEHVKSWNQFMIQVISNLIKYKITQNGTLVVFLWGKKAQNAFFQSINELNKEDNCSNKIELEAINGLSVNKRNRYKYNKINHVIQEEREIIFYRNLALYMTNHPSQISENNNGKFIEYSKIHFKACDKFLDKPVWENLWKYVNPKISSESSYLPTKSKGRLTNNKIKIQFLHQ